MRVRCSTFERPGIGTIHVHSKWWWPWGNAWVEYQPEGTQVAYRVPPDRLQELIHVTSWLEAMALIRREEQP